MQVFTEWILKVNPLPPGSNNPEVDRVFSELLLLSWLAQQKKERRRLAIAALESILDWNGTSQASADLFSELSTTETTALLPGPGPGSKQDPADRRDRNR